MAPSFLTLPPELRLQIYRYLLCHSSEIELQKTELPKCQAVYRHRIYEATEALSLESAISVMCRTVYAEAKPVLYGENIFSFLCWTIHFNIDEYRKTGFAYKNLKHLKHPILEVEEDPRFELEIAVEGVADTIQYLVERGADLRTFELVVNEFNVIRDDEERTHDLLKKFAVSEEFMTALVALNVSETLTISSWYYECAFDYELQVGIQDLLFPNLMERLSLEKKMSTTKQKPELIDQEFFDAEVDGEDDIAFNTYRLSWALSPRASDEQSTNVPGANAFKEGQSTSDTLGNSVRGC